MIPKTGLGVYVNRNMRKYFPSRSRSLVRFSLLIRQYIQQQLTSKPVTRQQRRFNFAEEVDCANVQANQAGTQRWDELLVTTSHQCRCNVMMLHRHWCDVV